MRASILFGMLLLGAASIVAVTPNMTRGQFPGGGKKGGFGGPGGGMSMMMNQDPGTIFDMLAKGRGFFLISETRSLRDPLTQYAQEKGISNGQITRNQYVDFHGQYKAKLDAAGPAPAFGGNSPFGGPGGNPFGGKGKKGFGAPEMGGGMMVPTGPAPNLDALNQQADMIFQRLDRNGDGKLNEEEMPGQLKASLDRFDKNRDRLIDLAEFREYFLARMTGDTDPNAARGGGDRIIIDEDELDRRPVVLRAGKLPANMPEWFKEYDLDGDGQVALHEWRKVGKKPLDEFREWDLNDDSFITPEEALKRQTLLAKDDPKTGRGGPGTSMASLDPGSNPGGRPSFMDGKKKGNKGGDPTSPFSGKKKKGGGQQD